MKRVLVIPALPALFVLLAGCTTVASSASPVPDGAPLVALRPAATPVVDAEVEPTRAPPLEPALAPPHATPLAPPGSPEAALVPTTTVALQPIFGPTVAADEVTVRESTVTLSVYPYEQFQSDAVDPVYGWPYKKFDMAAFRSAVAEGRAKPGPRTYVTLVLENRHIKATILPELGGRLLQVELKASGTRMFYANSVLKPTAWGPLEQGGWFALGGLEWNLPVYEHGYAWGEAWGYIPMQFDPQHAAVTVFTPQDGRKLALSVTMTLRAGSAALEIEPTVSNVGGEPLRFDYWHNAMLAPGNGESITGGIHFVLPTRAMMVHSSGDVRLPAGGQRVTWPIYSGRNLSLLHTWAEYAGLFEDPAAHGPFAAVYDRTQDAGAVRVYPAETTTGSKIFALGWGNPIDPALYTDDGSAYVELHAGLAPSFSQQAYLDAGASVSWRETWYPVHGLGDLTWANEDVAVDLRSSGGELTLALHAVRPTRGDVLLLGDAGELDRRPFAAEPGEVVLLVFATESLPAEARSLQIVDDGGALLLSLPLGEPVLVKD